MEEMYPSLDKVLIFNINGYDIDINKIVKTYGFFTRKFGAYAYLIGLTGMDMMQAKRILDPVYNYHVKKAESIILSENFIANLGRGSTFKK